MLHSIPDCYFCLCNSSYLDLLFHFPSKLPISFGTQLFWTCNISNNKHHPAEFLYLQHVPSWLGIHRREQYFCSPEDCELFYKTNELWVTRISCTHSSSGYLKIRLAAEHSWILMCALQDQIRFCCWTSTSTAVLSKLLAHSILVFPSQ